MISIYHAAMMHRICRDDICMPPTLRSKMMPMPRRSSQDATRGAGIPMPQHYCRSRTADNTDMSAEIAPRDIRLFPRCRFIDAPFITISMVIITVTRFIIDSDYAWPRDAATGAKVSSRNDKIYDSPACF